jgi:hypothetical protein
MNFFEKFEARGATGFDTRKDAVRAVVVQIAARVSSMLDDPDDVAITIFI